MISFLFHQMASPVSSGPCFGNFASQLHHPKGVDRHKRTSLEDLRSLRLMTAVKTPYLPDGTIDLEAYDALVNLQIVNGADSVLVGGSTGEGQLMSLDEKIMLIEHTVKCFGESIKVIGNTGSNSTSIAIRATEKGFAVGMDAALQISPYYGGTSLKGLVSHFDSVLSIGPAIIYNNPSRTGQDIPPEVIRIIAQNPNMVGIKELVGLDRIKHYTDSGVVVWSGHDGICHDARWVSGAAGVCSIAGNLVPGLLRDLMFGGMNPSLNSKLKPLIEWLFRERNPIGLNTALAQLGVVRPVFRLPYVPLPRAARVEFVKIVKEIGRENFVGQKDVQFLDDDDFIQITSPMSTGLCFRNSASKVHNPKVVNGPKRTSVDDIRSLRLMTAVKTPYLPDGKIDLEAYDALVNLQVVNGADSVLVGGSIGEGSLMSLDEKIMLIDHTVKCFGKSIKVIGNTGSNSTGTAIYATEQGFAVGMDAALQICPYYGGTSLKGLVSHFDCVLSVGPAIIYNNPSRTGQDIPPEVIQIIAQNSNMVGIKEVVGNDRVKHYVDNGVVVWSARDDLCYDVRWVFGAAGVSSIAGIGNLVPGLMRELMFGSMNPSLNSKVKLLIDWLYQERNPIGLNTALAQLGVVRPVFRLPYVPLPRAARVEFVKIVKEFGRENFVGEKDVQVLDDDDFILVSRY